MAVPTQHATATYMGSTDCYFYMVNSSHEEGGELNSSAANTTQHLQEEKVTLKGVKRSFATVDPEEFSFACHKRFCK